MRKKILAFLFAAALLVALALPLFGGVGTAPAFAKVHGVSQAGCGKSTNSGATQSSSTLTALIPVNASPFADAAAHPGQAENASPNGTNC